MGKCEYCHEDFDGYLLAQYPVVDNRFYKSSPKINITFNNVENSIRASYVNGLVSKVYINYCPMCGRNLHERESLM